MPNANSELTLCGAPVMERDLSDVNKFCITEFFILLAVLLCVLSMFVFLPICLFFYSFV